MFQNAQHRSITAVVRKARLAQIAPPADDVDLAYHALADEFLLRRRDDVPDELVTEHAGEAHVTLGDLQVGRADARLPHAHERIAQRYRRLRLARLIGEAVVED